MSVNVEVIVKTKRKATGGGSRLPDLRRKTQGEKFILVAKWGARLEWPDVEEGIKETIRRMQTRAGTSAEAPQVRASELRAAIRCEKREAGSVESIVEDLRHAFGIEGRDDVYAALAYFARNPRATVEQAVAHGKAIRNGSARARGKQAEGTRLLAKIRLICLRLEELDTDQRPRGARKAAAAILEIVERFGV